LGVEEEEEEEGEREVAAAGPDRIGNVAQNSIRAGAEEIE